MSQNLQNSAEDVLLKENLVCEDERKPWWFILQDGGFTLAALHSTDRSPAAPVTMAPVTTTPVTTAPITVSFLSLGCVTFSFVRTNGDRSN